MTQPNQEALETELAREIILLLNKHNLTASQAKCLLDKVRILVEAGEMGLFNTQH
jgi:hypothetical protein